ncbi:MAG: prephenate dehydratase [Limnochordia bacterium]
MTRIGYLGPRGTFTEQAVRAYVARQGIVNPVLVAHRTIADVLLAVEAGELQLGVVPAENSIEGSVVLTLDYLVHEVEVPIVGEVIITVRHSLLALPGADPTAVVAVYSHPHALAQCRRHLSEMLPGAELCPSSSTAEAAKIVRDKADLRLAAVGTELAAELYSLEVMARDLQDEEGNATRFFVVADALPEATGYDRTSISFAFPDDRPGHLYRALYEFACRDINLSKLESRPARRHLGEYIFLVDMEGHVDDTGVAQALEGLRHHCSFVRVLGSYPRDASSASQ